MAGYDIGVGLSVSGSSGASLSGATDISSGTKFGASYGPGAAIITDQRDSIGASAGGLNWPVLLGVGLLALVGYFFIWRRR